MKNVYKVVMIEVSTVSDFTSCRFIKAKSMQAIKNYAHSCGLIVAYIDKLSEVDVTIWLENKYDELDEKTLEMTYHD